jgi:adenylate cyclase
MTTVKFKHKILLVDDDPGNLNFLRLAFRDDYLVLTAEDGLEALDILKRPENFDIALILTDERMPKISGTELLKESLDTHPNTIRWIITAYPEEKDSIYDKKDIQVDRYIRKPIIHRIDELKDDVKDAVHLYELRRENQHLRSEISELIEKDNRVRNLFSKYLPPEVIRKFEKKEPHRLREVEEKEVTVLYVDIRKFTAISEELGPQKTVQLLNEYFNEMSKIIVKHKGTIDKYFGDAIMAIFGIRDSEKPDSTKDAQDAVKCALEMRRALLDFNRNTQKTGMPEIHFGIGINTGKAVVGNIGSDYFFDYTVIGETVNMAARIQKLSRDGEGDNRILIGEETYGYARGMIGDHFKDLGFHKVKGKEESVQVYEILDFESKK